METQGQEPAIIDAADAPCGTLHVSFRVKATTVEHGQIVEDTAREPGRIIGVRIEFANRSVLKVVFPPNTPESIQRAVQQCAGRLVASLNRVDTVVECLLPSQVVDAYTGAAPAVASATLSES